jgi:hypothetical protein
VNESERARRKANLARYLGNDPRTHRALIRAPSRVPDDVLDVAIDKCAFFSLGGAGNGQCLPSRFIEGAEWLLLIYDDAPDIETVIAHEVAHAYLGHSITDPLMPHEETERQARDLVRSWVSPAKGPITDRYGSRRAAPVLSPALRTLRFAGCFDSSRGHFRATASLFTCRVAPCPRLGSRIPAQAWHPPARAGSS